ncbi:MAG: toxin [Bacteroidia bacterium]
MTSRTEVDAFLYTFKQLKKQNGLIILDREKNLQALLDMELTAQRRDAIIMGLKPQHYYRGPRPDEIRQGFEFWEFGRKVDVFGESYTLYIKLSIRFENMPVVCLSFHPAEREMIFPFENIEKP